MSLSTSFTGGHCAAAARGQLPPRSTACPHRALAGAVLATRPRDTSRARRLHAAARIRQGSASGRRAEGACAAGDSRRMAGRLSGIQGRTKSVWFRMIHVGRVARDARARPVGRAGDFARLLLRDLGAFSFGGEEGALVAHEHRRIQIQLANPCGTGKLQLILRMGRQA